MADILIVDDEPDILETLPDVLHKWGHRTFVARNGAEGVQLFGEHHIDFVITDMKMPEMDGVELLHHILQKDSGAMVIFLTGYPSLDTAITALRSGAYDYLVKPVNLDELKLKIGRASCRERV